MCKKFGTVVSLLIAAIVIWISFASGHILLSISKPSPPGSIGKMDLFDERNRTVFILNCLLPIELLLLVAHSATQRKLTSSLIAVISVAASGFVVVAVWIHLIQLHAPGIDLWERIWWH